MAGQNIASGLSQSSRINIAVLVPELLGAPAATLGAVYCMEKAPKTMDWLTRWTSEHIVSPHLDTFERLGKGLKTAHNEYHERKNRERIARGEAPVPQIMETREERAMGMSDVMVKTFIALGADFAATYGLQRVLGKALKADIKPLKTAMTELTTHIGVMALMPTVFAKQSEQVHYKLSHGIQDTFGASKKHANDQAAVLTYINMPGWVAAIASLMYAHGTHLGKQR